MEKAKLSLFISFFFFLSIAFGCVGQSHEINSTEIQSEKTADQATGILHDPIENNPEFKNIFATIDSEVDEALKHHPMRGGEGFCYIYWDVKKKILSERYGINWKTPAEMNPHILFD